MAYAVMIEPFPHSEGLEYVHESDTHSWNKNNPIKLFVNKEDAEKEASKWNTGIVVEYPETEYTNAQYTY